MMYIWGMISDILGICHNNQIEELAMTIENLASTNEDFAMNFMDGQT